MNATSNQEGTPAPVTTVNTFKFSLYGVEHEVPVNANLSESIREVLINANRGKSPSKEGLSYQAPSTEVIREQIISRFITKSKEGFITHFKKGGKIDFASKSTAGKVVAFIYNTEMCHG